MTGNMLWTLIGLTLIVFMATMIGISSIYVIAPTIAALTGAAIVFLVDAMTRDDK